MTHEKNELETSMPEQEKKFCPRFCKRKSYCKVGKVDTEKIYEHKYAKIECEIHKNLL